MEQSRLTREEINAGIPARILYLQKYYFVYMKRLYRSKKESMLGGICGGLAEYIDVDPSIIRLVFVVMLVFSMGLAILVYIAAWFIIPESSDETPALTPVTDG
jgi:phage shock protein C